MSWGLFKRLLQEYIIVTCVHLMKPVHDSQDKQVLYTA